MSGCGGSGQSYAFRGLPFDKNPDGSLLPPTQVGKAAIKILGLKNPSAEESQFVHGIAIRPGTDLVNFVITEVKVGNTIQSSRTGIVVPPSEVLTIEIHYTPKSKTEGDAFHRAIVEVSYGDPRPGIVQIEVTGRAQGEMPVVQASDCEVAACIFDPQVTLTLSSKGVPNPPPPKTFSFSGPILIREEGDEMILDGLEFPYVILHFTKEEVQETTSGVLIVLDGKEGAKGKVTIGEDGKVEITDFAVRVRLYLDTKTNLDQEVSRTGPDNQGVGEVEGVGFTTESIEVTGNKDTLTASGQRPGEDGIITLVTGIVMPDKVFSGQLENKGNAKLGGGALKAVITGRFERGQTSE